MQSDRELLELAAKAAGLKIHEQRQAERNALQCSNVGLWIVGEITCWNPLTDDGDALRLAVKLRLPMNVFCVLREPGHDDPYAATRRAVVRAAAEIAKQISKE